MGKITINCSFDVGCRLYGCMHECAEYKSNNIKTTEKGSKWKENEMKRITER